MPGVSKGLDHFGLMRKVRVTLLNSSVVRKRLKVARVVDPVWRVEVDHLHLGGHAFGNRIARCLAVDRPSLVRSVTLLAAGGLIGPSTPLGTSFRNATEVKMNGSDCVTVLGARWLSPASDPKVLAQVECWPAVVLAHFATSRGMALEEWWGAGTAPLLVIQGLDDEVAPPGNGHALREQFGERVRVIDLPRAGHFLPLEQPEAVTRAVAEFVGAGAGPR